jgi:hypothetical protein
MDWTEISAIASVLSTVIIAVTASLALVQLNLMLASGRSFLHACKTRSFARRGNVCTKWSSSPGLRRATECVVERGILIHVRQGAGMAAIAAKARRLEAEPTLDDSSLPV